MSKITILPKADQNWVIQKISDTATNIQLKMNQIRMSWPKVSTVIYPKQSLRINTGWKTQQMPQNMTMTSIPHKSLIDNNLLSLPQIIDSSNKGQQFIQVVSNNNTFPVKIQYQTNQDGQQTFMLLRLHESTLLQQQILQFDFGNFLTGVAQVAAQVLPVIF